MSINEYIKMKSLYSYIVNLCFRVAFFREGLWSALVILVMAVVALLLFQSGDVITKPVGWEKSYYVSPYNLKVKNVNVASQGNYVITVYEGDDRGRHGIYVSVSFDGGMNFLKPIMISEANNIIDNNPKVAISGNGHIFVAWQNHIVEEATNRIFYVKSVDMGAQWSQPQQIFMGYEMEMLPRVYYDDRGILHLFYHAFAGGAFNLFHAESSDEVKFTTTQSLIKLTPEMKGAFFPAIHFSGPGVYMVWQGKGRNFTDDLYYTRSSNYGKSWSSMELITTSAANSEAPDLFMKDDSLYVVYQNNDEKSWSIKLLIGREKGADWSARPVTISDTRANCYAPKLALSRSNELLIAWYDTREGRSKIFTRLYNTRTRELSAEEKISQEPPAARNPFAVTAGNKAIVFWEAADRIIAKLTDVYAAPPRVYSVTHPEGVWSRNSVARIEWVPPFDESEIVGYATMVSKPMRGGITADLNPTIQNLNAGTKRMILPELEDGITYFHIRSVDGAGNYSRTIHYKIQVSSNPLPMPIVLSPTHPQGKAVDSREPVFRWTIDDTERLKGFVYSLSKDSVSRPETFTTNFETKFSGLESGIYFFSLGAIDKTNQRSRIADYYIVVGDVENITPEDLLNRTKRKEPVDMRWLARAKEPSLRIVFPFDTAKPWSGEAFKAPIEMKNVRQEQVLGYSLYIDRKKGSPPLKVSQKNNIMTVDNLATGTYHVSVRAKYYRIANGRKEYLWSRESTAEFSVLNPGIISPVQHYGRLVVGKLTGRGMLVSLFIMGMTIATVTVGFGGRIAFYGRMMQFKMRSVVRLIL